MQLSTIIKKVTAAKKTKTDKKIYFVYSTCPCEEPSCYHYMEYISNTRNSVLLMDINGIATEFFADDTNCIHGVELLTADFHRKFRNTVKAKKPTVAKENYVGVELEFISKIEPIKMAEMMVENGLEDFVTVKDDGSVDTESGYPYSFELNVLAKHNEVYDVIRKLCSLIEDKSKANDSCGLHVHLDMRNRDAGKSYANLFSAQGLFYSMQPFSRLDNTFCNPAFEYFGVRNDEDERYRCVNKCSLSKYRTLEVRVHQGTVNSMEICNWIRLLHKIIEADRIKKPKILQDLETIKKTFSLDPATMKYVVERCKKFQKDQDDRVDFADELEFSLNVNEDAA